MKFTLFAFSAAIVATQGAAIEMQVEVDELSNEVLFPQVAAFMNTLSNSDLEQVENYMSQIFSSSSSEDEGSELLA